MTSSTAITAADRLTDELVYKKFFQQLKTTGGVYSMMMHICFTSYIVQSEFYTFRYFDTMMFLLLTVTYRVLFFQWLSLALFSSYLNITKCLSVLSSICQFNESIFFHERCHMDCLLGILRILRFFVKITSHFATSCLARVHGLGRSQCCKHTARCASSHQIHLLVALHNVTADGPHTYILYTPRLTFYIFILRTTRHLHPSIISAYVRVRQKTIIKGGESFNLIEE